MQYHFLVAKATNRYTFLLAAVPFAGHQLMSQVLGILCLLLSLLMFPAMSQPTTLTWKVKEKLNVLVGLVNLH